jgi:hypothetical protein
MKRCPSLIKIYHDPFQFLNWSPDEDGVIKICSWPGGAFYGGAIRDTSHPSQYPNAAAAVRVAAIKIEAAIFWLLLYLLSDSSNLTIQLWHDLLINGLWIFDMYC